jgi:hypothetical protein
LARTSSSGLPREPLALGLFDTQLMFHLEKQLSGVRVETHGGCLLVYGVDGIASRTMSARASLNV